MREFDVHCSGTRLVFTVELPDLVPGWNIHLDSLNRFVVHTHSLRVHLIQEAGLKIYESDLDHAKSNAQLNLAINRIPSDAVLNVLSNNDELEYHALASEDIGDDFPHFVIQTTDDVHTAYSESDSGAFGPADQFGRHQAAISGVRGIGGQIPIYATEVQFVLRSSYPTPGHRLAVVRLALTGDPHGSVELLDLR